MKIKKSVLAQMVREEFLRYIKEECLTEISEGPKDDDKGADVVDAEKETKGKETPDAKKADDGKGKNTKVPTAKELPVSDEPEADGELEKDVAQGEEGEEEDAEDVTGGKIADQITGKTIQSVTLEPKSKTLPGAQELVITFREIPDPLKVLLTKTGQVKFFFKGLHNEV